MIEATDEQDVGSVVGRKRPVLQINRVRDKERLNREALGNRGAVHLGRNRRKIDPRQPVADQPGIAKPLRDLPLGAVRLLAKTEERSNSLAGKNVILVEIDGNERTRLRVVENRQDGQEIGAGDVDEVI